MKTVIEWNDGLPKADGKYLVVWWADRKLSDMYYTVNGGWNTYYKDGELMGANIEKEHVYAWAEIPEVTDVKKELGYEELDT